jgi:hypothetical protein
MKRQSKPPINPITKLFLLDMQGRIDALEPLFKERKDRVFAITSYNQEGISRTPIDHTNFSSSLPRGFDVYMLHVPLTTEEAIFDLMQHEPLANIWLNTAMDPLRLKREVREGASGYYSAAQPEYQVDKVIRVLAGGRMQKQT